MTLENDDVVFDGENWSHFFPKLPNDYSQVILQAWESRGCDQEEARERYDKMVRNMQDRAAKKTEFHLNRREKALKFESMQLQVDATARRSGVDRARRVQFIHIPKCGGSSIRGAIGHKLCIRRNAAVRGLVTQHYA